MFVGKEARTRANEYKKLLCYFDRFKSFKIVFDRNFLF